MWQRFNRNWRERLNKNECFPRILVNAGRKVNLPAAKPTRISGNKLLGREDDYCRLCGGTTWVMVRGPRWKSGRNLPRKVSGEAIEERLRIRGREFVQNKLDLNHWQHSDSEHSLISGHYPFTDKKKNSVDSTIQLGQDEAGNCRWVQWMPQTWFHFRGIR